MLVTVMSSENLLYNMLCRDNTMQFFINVNSYLHYYCSIIMNFEFVTEQFSQQLSERESVKFVGNDITFVAENVWV